MSSKLESLAGWYYAVDWRPADAGGEEVLKEMGLMTIEMVNMTHELQRKNREQQEAQAKIKVLAALFSSVCTASGTVTTKGAGTSSKHI